MAALNFPSDPSTQNPVNTYSPDSTPLASDNGVTYVWDGEKWTANSGGGNLDDVYVNVNGDTMTGDLTVPSLNGGPLAGMRNAIINGCLRIFQRGTAGGTNSGAAYVSADRWRLSNSTAGTSLNQRSSCPQGFSGSTALASGASIQQKIENWEMFSNGSTWTASFIADNSGLTVRVVNDDGAFDSGQLAVTQGDTIPARVGSDTWHRYYVSYTLPANATGATFPYVALEITNPTGSQINLVGIQLEPGPVATPFEMRPIGLELQLCQRYYEKWGAIPVMPLVGDGSGGQSQQAFFAFKTEKRAIPTCTRGAYTVKVDGSVVAVTDVALTDVTTESLKIYVLGVPATYSQSVGVGLASLAIDAEL